MSPPTRTSYESLTHIGYICILEIGPLSRTLRLNEVIQLVHLWKRAFTRDQTCPHCAWTSSLQTCEKRNVCCLSHPVCIILLWRPAQINTDSTLSLSQQYDTHAKEFGVAYLSRITEARIRVKRIMSIKSQLIRYSKNTISMYKKLY